MLILDRTKAARFSSWKRRRVTVHVDMHTWISTFIRTYVTLHLTLRICAMWLLVVMFIMQCCFAGESDAIYFTTSLKDI